MHTHTHGYTYFSFLSKSSKALDDILDECLNPFRLTSAPLGAVSLVSTSLRLCSLWRRNGLPSLRECTLLETAFCILFDCVFLVVKLSVSEPHQMCGQERVYPPQHRSLVPRSKIQTWTDALDTCKVLNCNLEGIKSHSECATFNYSSVLISDFNAYSQGLHSSCWRLLKAIQPVRYHKLKPLSLDELGMVFGQYSWMLIIDCVKTPLQNKCSILH